MRTRYLLHHLLEATAAAYPAKEAIVDKQRHISYREFVQSVSTCAAVLREQGLERRDRVGDHTSTPSA